MVPLVHTLLCLNSTDCTKYFPEISVSPILSRVSNTQIRRRSVFPGPWLLFSLTSIYFLRQNAQYLGVYIIHKIERKKITSYILLFSFIWGKMFYARPRETKKHKAIIQLLAASIIFLPTMVKRCDFTSKQEEKAWTHLGSVFKKLIYVSCWVLHLQFKQNPTWLPQRVWFIRYQGVARSHVIKTVINWKRKVPPEFWEAVNFISITALLVLLLDSFFPLLLDKKTVNMYTGHRSMFFRVLKHVWMATYGKCHTCYYLFQVF